MIQVYFYRYHPDLDTQPRIDRVDHPGRFHGRMVLDALDICMSKTPLWSTGALSERVCAAPAV